jgi:hypothetical protein
MNGYFANHRLSGKPKSVESKTKATRDCWSSEVIAALTAAHPDAPANGRVA